MPFKTYTNWLFDGSRSTTIPTPKYSDDGQVLVPDILKYNSPITHTFAIQMFMKNGPMNDYLDRYFNNINLRYLDKEELFYFIKKCVLDFKVKRWDMVYYKRSKTDKLFNILRDRLAHLKNGDIILLCDLIEKSEDKTQIYHTLGLETPKKRKISIKKKSKKKDKISLEELLEENFSIYREDSSK
jgi:hypothetical protein